MRRRCTPMRCSCSSRGAEPATSPARACSACTASSSAFSRRTSTIPARAICTCTPPSRRSCPSVPTACAEFLGKSIPGASHINHMPSHTWNEVGRWGDSVRANLEAWHSDLKAAIGEGFAIYPVAQPAHAAVRGVDGWPGRDRDAGGQGLREADRRFVLSGADDGPLRPVRRGAGGEEPSEGRHPGRVVGFLAGLRAPENR